MVTFIDKEKSRGSSNINVYMVVLYKKFSLPVSAFINYNSGIRLSDERGGMGMNLTIGIAVALVLSFLIKFLVS
jgi:lipopolysaccharide export system permease protein